MASVTPVQTPELRSNSPSSQAPKSGDPFAMLLDHVSAKRATAPEPRRRADAPDAPRVNGADRPERPQPKQAARPGTDKSKPVTPGAKNEAAPEECAVEGKAETQDTAAAPQADAPVSADTDAPMTEAATIPANAEALPGTPASQDQAATEETAVVEGDDTAEQPEISADANAVIETQAPAQPIVQQVSSEAAPVPAPAAVVEAAVEAAPEGSVAPVAAKTDAPAPTQPKNNQPAVAADAEAAVSGEEAPQTAPQAAQPEEASPVSKPVASNHAETRDAALAEKGEQAAQNTTASKPEVPAQAKEHASAKPLEHAPAQSNVENSAPRQQVTPQTAPVMPEPVRALAGSINPVNLRAANDGPNNAVQLNAQAIGVEIASRAKEGMRRFDIRLDPPELGRIDVRLEVDNHGKASTRLIVERPETLDLLQRDARNLERALQSAGLNTEEGGLEFSLRDQGQNGLADAGTDRGYDRRDDFLASAIEDAEPASPALERYARSVLARGGVDIRI